MLRTRFVVEFLRRWIRNDVYVELSRDVSNKFCEQVTSPIKPRKENSLHHNDGCMCSLTALRVSCERKLTSCMNTVEFINVTMQ